MAARIPLRLDIVDSHTAGEPTRCVMGGLPELGSGTLALRLERLREEFDHWRRAVLCEPRGSDVLVGAYLLEPVDPKCAAGVIFFNNTGYLGMCGHGTIGVVATLAHLGRIGFGAHWIETPVGTVRVELHDANRVSIRNVPAYRYRTGVGVEAPGYQRIAGDVAWGGNWFFLAGVDDVPFTVGNVGELTDFTWAIRGALASAGITGANGAEIDHIELYSAAHHPGNHSRNFVLCPGKAYDRSPCGTGTSAKLACLAAEGLLEPGQLWRQEGILGTVFEGSYRFEDADLKVESDNDSRETPAIDPRIIPTVTGSAYVTMEGTMIFDPRDPFQVGVPE